MVIEHEVELILEQTRRLLSVEPIVLQKFSQFGCGFIRLIESFNVLIHF